MNAEVKQAMDAWFTQPGAFVLVDGQYGSTGKGLIAGALAECFWDRVDLVVSNAGPNSGHTSYFRDEKIVLKQLPTFAVIARRESNLNDHVWTHLSAGAVLDLELLFRERMEHKIEFMSIHPHAAVIHRHDKVFDKRTTERIASTGQGVGPALMRKIQRVDAGIMTTREFTPGCVSYPAPVVTFMEIPQGFSLGINSGFYPHVTSRECSVSQALSDAGMPPSFHRKTIMVVRTFPIRVGNFGDVSSGPCYRDQKEISWGLLEPELTTVTQRQRRLFTWSAEQYRHALQTLDPNVVALTFCDYLGQDETNSFVRKNVWKPYIETLNRNPEAILLSFGPRSSDIQVWRP